ncbi:MAG: patatin-like phospholipase family protein [Defluviicoccus sp.]|nr:patatin-like phospholipase family protein [Defluviicoccus sp.]
MTAPLISALGYRLFRDRRALWRGVCSVLDWLQKHVLNTSQPELSFPPVQGRPVTEGPVNPKGPDPTTTRTVFIPPSRQELLRGAGGIGGLGVSKYDPRTELGKLLENLGPLLRTNFPLLLELLKPAFPLLAAILFAPFLIGTLIFDPITQGWTLGPIAVVFYIATLWLLGITALIIASRRHNIPIFLVLILLTLGFGWAGWGDNHDVRRADADAGSPQPASDPALRPSLTDVVAQWQERSLQQSPGAAALPLIVVATAGGGQRAALWTATVLSKLEAGNALFRQQVLAISGVSGGALGATLFVAADGSAATEEQRSERLKTLFASDFLTPLVVRFLSTDILQQLFPVAVFSDRAATLEQTWEQAWAHVFEDRPERFAQPFLRLWPHDQPWPVLLLNGTWVENGRRVIASNIRMGTDFDAHDVLDVLHHDVPVSTAVDMSTRFPYVTPAGVVRTPDGAVFGHVVDGGYFENFGATTAVEVLRTATAYLAKHSGGAAIVPIVVMITSDPAWKDGAPPPITQPLAKSGPASQLTAPIETLDAVRTEHGKAAVAALQAAAGPSKDRFFHFRLCEESDKRQPILGWAFNPTTIDQIVGQRERCGNDAEFARFAAVLGGFKPTAQP